MLLVEITINGTVNRVSADGHALVNNWPPRVIAFDAPTMAIPSDHGGFAKLTYGSIAFNPILFRADWPPPVSCPIAIYYSDTTEAARELVLSGTAHLGSFDRESISYSIFGPSYDETIADGTVYSDTLANVLTTILTSVTEITSVNTSLARSPSPAVSHTTSGEQLAIDLASNMAQFFSHLFYVHDGTAHLVDMKVDNGSRTLTEFQFFAFPKYQYKAPTSKALASVADTEYSQFSDYPYGSDLSETPYHSAQVNIETALADVLDLENAPRISFDMPMIAGNFPLLGEKITLPDSGNVLGLLSWIRSRKLQYDFLGQVINVEGEGEIAAAAPETFYILSENGYIVKDESGNPLTL